MSHTSALSSKWYIFKNTLEVILVVKILSCSFKFPSYPMFITLKMEDFIIVIRLGYMVQLTWEKKLSQVALALFQELFTSGSCLKLRIQKDTIDLKHGRIQNAIFNGLKMERAIWSKWMKLLCTKSGP
jgi:hypothetical protein